MAMKEYPILPKVHRLKPHNQIVCAIHRKLVGRGFTLLQKCSRCIQQPLPMGIFGMCWLVLYWFSWVSTHLHLLGFFYWLRINFFKDSSFFSQILVTPMELYIWFLVCTLLPFLCGWRQSVYLDYLFQMSSKNYQIWFIPLTSMYSYMSIGKSIPLLTWSW